MSDYPGGARASTDVATVMTGSIGGGGPRDRGRVVAVVRGRLDPVDHLYLSFFQFALVNSSGSGRWRTQGTEGTINKEKRPSDEVIMK
jgi:hypothetical protein